MNIEIRITGLDEARAKLRKLGPDELKKTIESPRTLRQIGTDLVASAVETYQMGGRPKWADNAESTKAR